MRPRHLMGVILGEHSPHHTCVIARSASDKFYLFYILPKTFVDFGYGIIFV